MTTYFANEFLRAHACSSCRKSAPKYSAAGKKMCSTHLEIARLSFRLWSAARRESGGCCECSKAALPGKGRCRRHRAKNRRECREYRQANLERERLRHANARHEWLRQNRCPACSLHPELPEGFRRCDDCRARHQATRAIPRDAAQAATIEQIKARTAVRLSNFRSEKKARQTVEARARLLELGYRFVTGDEGRGWCSKVVLDKATP